MKSKLFLLTMSFAFLVSSFQIIFVFNNNAFGFDSIRPFYPQLGRDCFDTNDVKYTIDCEIKIQIVTPNSPYEPDQITFINGHNNKIMQNVNYDVFFIATGGSIAGEFLNQNAVNGEGSVNTSLLPDGYFDVKIVIHSAYGIPLHFAKTITYPIHLYTQY